ncbi:MAG TPA: Npun_R1517 family heterocyst differentiation transcriptional regulator [Nodosilinea sp.]|nr:Npun_R1517 family heterocyst differentiation transcriptional regulator [Nodosilinea sp.]
MATSAPHPSIETQVAIYECAVTLKFRILEESHVMTDQDDLLELLIDAFSYGSDEFVETIESHLEINKVPEIQASPLMRRQLIRLRNMPAG